LSAADAAAVIEIHDECMNRKVDLDQDVMRGEISGEEFAVKVNALTQEYLQRVEERIGPDSFRALFELEPGERIGVLDPEIAKTLNVEVAATR
jgi:hypothetical protein